MKGDFTRQTFRAEHHYRGVLEQQGRVRLDADGNEQVLIQQHLDEEVTGDVLGPHGGPTGHAAFGIETKGGGPVRDSALTDLVLTEGHYYVGGILCENETAIPLAEQPDLPGFSPKWKDGDYTAYLDVWTEHLTALERPALREVALGGPDTATRMRTIWQLRLRAKGSPLPSSTGTLKARAHQPAQPPTPCAVPESAGYRRLENQLYRVEIRGAGDGAGGGATYVWSRENGSVTARVLKVEGARITVDSTGRDSRLAFEKGDWVQVTDLADSRTGSAGQLGHIDDAVGDVLTITGTDGKPLPGVDPDAEGALLRRWDSDGERPVEFGTWIPLEGGVEVWFEPGTFAVGDYWLIPARTANLDGADPVAGLAGNVEWPLDRDRAPLPRTPDGVLHRYADIATLTAKADTWTLISDDRLLFDPLSGRQERLTLEYGDGDGQGGEPGGALPDPVVVVLRRGTKPVPGGTVLFVTDVDGALAATAADLAGSRDFRLRVTTEADGTATCFWRLGRRTPLQALTAAVVDAADALDPTVAPVPFVAGVDPGSPFATGLHVTGAVLTGPGSTLTNDALVSASDLAGGVAVILDAAADPAGVDDQPVLRVTLDLPYPLAASDRELWGDGVVGTTALTLAGQVAARDVSGNPAVAWVPRHETAALLTTSLFPVLQKQTGEDHVLGRVTLAGRAVAAVGAAEQVVNGLALGGRAALRLPSIDDVRGADFELWFRLVPRIGDLLLVPTKGSRLILKSAGDAIALAVPRDAFRASLPTGISARAEPAQDLVKARQAIERVFRNGNERRLAVVAHERYTAAMELIRVALDQLAVTVEVSTTADPVTEVTTRRQDQKQVDGVLIDSSDLASVRALPDMVEEVPL